MVTRPGLPGRATGSRREWVTFVSCVAGSLKVRTPAQKMERAPVGKGIIDLCPPWGGGGAEETAAQPEGHSFIVAAPGPDTPAQLPSSETSWRSPRRSGDLCACRVSVEPCRGYFRDGISVTAHERQQRLLLGVDSEITNKRHMTLSAQKLNQPASKLQRFASTGRRYRKHLRTKRPKQRQESQYPAASLFGFS